MSKANSKSKSKKKKKNPIRLFHEKWKWYFVNAYIIIAIAIIVHLHFVCFVSNDSDAKQIEEPKNEVVAEETIIETPTEEPEVLADDKENTLIEQEKEELVDQEEKICDPPAPNSIILINEKSKTDRAASAILVNEKDAKIIEVSKEFDSALIDSLTQMAEEEAQDVYIIGGAYVVSEQSEANLSAIDNITVYRLSGGNMESTGVAIIDHISDDVDFSKCYVINASLPESCALATKKVIIDGVPVFMVDYSGLSDVVAHAISKYGVKQIELLGSGIGSKTISALEQIVGSENVIK